MLERTQAAVEAAGHDDKLVAAAIFFPRGHFGGAFAGGMIGDSVLPGGDRYHRGCAWRA